MSLKPQVRVSIINEILSHEGKKIDDLFLMKDLRDAISALERNDTIQGIAARADYLSYTNQPDQALILINRSIKKYGNNVFFARSKTNAAEYTGKWDIIKKTYEEVLLSEKSEITNEALKRYIELSDLYIDNTGNFMGILEKYEIVDKERISFQIESIAQQILNQDISLSAYRKTIGIAFSVIFEGYSMPLGLTFNSTKLQFIISSEYWSHQELSEVTEAINDAIMDDNDLDFQVEADEIEVFCINFPVEKLPEDFSYYEEDIDADRDLVSMIQARMEANTSPEVDGELLDV